MLLFLAINLSVDVPIKFAVIKGIILTTDSRGNNGLAESKLNLSLCGGDIGVFGLERAVAIEGR